MKAHPFRSYYLPLGVFLLASTIALREVVEAQSLQERMAWGVTMVGPLFTCVLWVRFWRWPKGILPKRSR